MITLKELSVKCGVSIATVSNILNGKGSVSEETKARVLRIAKETGYKPNYMARGLRAAKTKLIGLIIEDLTLFSSPDMIEGMMAYLEERGYKAIMENMRFYSRWGNDWRNKPEFYTEIKSALDEMLAINVDGIIYVAGHTRVIDAVDSSFPVPVVMAYALPADDSISSVIIDDLNSAVAMCDLVFSKGYKNVGIIAGEKENFHTIQRLAGCKVSFEKAGMILDDNRIEYANWSRKGGYDSCVELFKKNPELDAVFCFNDYIAAGVYDYLKENNLEVKKDVGVAGFDNRSESTFLNPKLTTAEISLKDIGSEAARILLEQTHEHIAVSCNKIERESI